MTTNFFIMTMILALRRVCTSFSIRGPSVRVPPISQPTRSSSFVPLVVGCIARYSSSKVESVVSFRSNGQICHSNSRQIEQENWKNKGCQTCISNLLMCGDGDLSFSAEIAEPLSQCNIQLVATVLEDEKTHRDVYQRSNTNDDRIKSFSKEEEGVIHEVQYGVDATKLEERFPNTKFDRIRFNFPHWRGKANHRYNRQLVDAFLKSASLVLADGGEIHIALCEGQGGSNAKSLQEYRDTWTPSYFASMHGLMLIDVFPFLVRQCLDFVFHSCMIQYSECIITIVFQAFLQSKLA